ncbi:MAG: Holliday junction branch migration protein RuvA [Clostridia bacterium]|nr:Holliday junction branch migration protein RuvA [Clostridia bacterium]
MIGYLNGKLVSFDEGTVILSVGGVGFEVACSSAAQAELVKNGGGEIYVYTAVKEDGISLYGFISQEEKRAFSQLVSVSGVGPKIGITILSQMSLNALITAIATSDVKTLSSVKGLGKKTAERLILELKDKIGTAGVDVSSVAPVTGTANADAVAALVSLGFTKNESETAVLKAEADGADTLQKIIAQALKNVR